MPRILRRASRWLRNGVIIVAGSGARGGLRQLQHNRTKPLHLWASRSPATIVTVIISSAYAGVCPTRGAAAPRVKLLRRCSSIMLRVTILRRKPMNRDVRSMLTSVDANLTKISHHGSDCSELCRSKNVPYQLGI